MAKRQAWIAILPKRVHLVFAVVATGHAPTETRHQLGDELAPLRKTRATARPSGRGPLQRRLLGVQRELSTELLSERNSPANRWLVGSPPRGVHDLCMSCALGRTIQNRHSREGSLGENCSSTRGCQWSAEPAFGQQLEGDRRKTGAWFEPTCHAVLLNLLIHAGQFQGKFLRRLVLVRDELL